MKAVAVFPAVKSIRLIHIPEPVIQKAWDVKVRMLEVGICGTDKDIAHFHYGTPPAGSDHLVLGHESLGEVIETGHGVKSFKKGDLAVLMVRRPCTLGNCVACAAGRQDFCYSGAYSERGIKEADGFLTEFVVDDEKYLIKIPSALRNVGVLTEPLTIAEKALEQLFDIQERLPWGCRQAQRENGDFCHTAVVLGAGPVALLGAMLLISNGFKTFVYSRGDENDAKALLVKSIGGEYVSSEKMTPEQLAAKTGNIDVVYEATGAAQISFEVMKVLGTNGVFIFTGVPGLKGEIELDASLIMKNLVLKNQAVYGTVNAGRKDFEAAVKDLARFVERWPKETRAIITARHPLEKAPELLLDPPPGIKHVIKLV